MRRAEQQGDPPIFDSAFRDRLAKLFAWRRDVRRFKPDPVPSPAHRGTLRPRRPRALGRQQSAVAFRERRNAFRAGGGDRQFQCLQRGRACILRRRTRRALCQPQIIGAARGAGSSRRVLRPCDGGGLWPWPKNHAGGVGLFGGSRRSTLFAFARVRKILALDGVDPRSEASLPRSRCSSAQWKLIAYLCVGFPLGRTSRSGARTSPLAGAS